MSYGKFLDFKIVNLISVKNLRVWIWYEFRLQEKDKKRDDRRNEMSEDGQNTQNKKRKGVQSGQNEEKRK